MLTRRFDGRGRGGPPSFMGRDQPDSASRDRMRKRIISRMRDELALTAVQERSLDSVFQTHERQLDVVRGRVRPSLDSLRDQMRAGVDSALTPEQRVKLTESRKRREAERSRGGRGGGDRSRR
jgi:vacuolar-type H+-ATPase subunit E/Vma4